MSQQKDVQICLNLILSFKLENIYFHVISENIMILENWGLGNHQKMF